MVKLYTNLSTIRLFVSKRFWQVPHILDTLLSSFPPKIMGTSRRIAPEIREQILKRIKDDGIPVAQAANEHGIHETTVYGWLSSKASSGPTLRELNALRKENAMLKTLVGEMTVTLSRSQKKR